MWSRFLLPRFFAMALAGMSPGAHATETPEIRFPPMMTVAERELVLNGTATRSFFGIRVYETGLYLNVPSNDEVEIMERNSGPKRLKIVMARSVPKASFASAVRDNLNRNFSAVEGVRFAAELEAFFRCFASGEDLKKGTEVLIDYWPEKGTVVTVSGETLAVIPGREFYHALLRLWIGKPLQASMKASLLGSATSR